MEYEDKLLILSTKNSRPNISSKLSIKCGLFFHINSETYFLVILKQIKTV